ncbi:MAG: EF hand [Planctomycetes bacterium ADurb.Bin126]|mgnify:FL=1|nr:MAG: EF hand [Planctomycetes bacterium ADurb.Bin126]HOD83358.1 EF-hand domain-containing protein [Phycisphaerae bacterium]HQL76102.1 EF-hand domain-containing protein [Phycisphaerae bacterium]
MKSKNYLVALAALVVAVVGLTVLAQPSGGPRRDSQRGKRGANEVPPPPPGGEQGEGQRGQGQGPGGGQRMPHPLMHHFDTDRDGTISAEEIANAVAVLKKLDTNGDGKITRDELPLPPRQQGGQGRGAGQGQGPGPNAGPGPGAGPGQGGQGGPRRGGGGRGGRGDHQGPPPPSDE